MGNGKPRVNLKQVAVAECPLVDWGAMEGDDRVRRCGSCKHEVFNLSAMTEQEAEAVLARERACLRYEYRADGTILMNVPRTSEPRTSTALAASVAGALVFSTAFVGIRAVVDDPNVATEDSHGVRVACGIKLDIKPYKHRKGRAARAGLPMQAGPVDDSAVSDAPRAGLYPASAPAPWANAATPAPVAPSQAPRWPTWTTVASLLLFVVTFGLVRTRQPEAHEPS